MATQMSADSCQISRASVAPVSTIAIDNERGKGSGRRGEVFTCSGCRGAWPPSLPAEVCSFRARPPDRLQGPTWPRSVHTQTRKHASNIHFYSNIFMLSSLFQILAMINFT